MLSRCYLIPERHGQIDTETDGRTDRQTDRIATSISRVSMLTRDKNRRLIIEGIKEIMSYELGPVPPAMLEARNVFRKADKPQLASVIRAIMQGMPC